MTDELKRNANLVEALGSALREGGHAVGTVPGLIHRVLEEGSWQEFVTQRGEHVCHERFADFVTAPPLRGIGGSVSLIRRLIGDKPEAVALLEQALQEGSRPGFRSDLVANRNEVVGGAARPTGTTREYALRRLRRDSPDLHAAVVAGRLSAHAAMVEAGFRPETFTVRSSSPPDKIVDVLRRKLPADTLAEVIRRLT